MLFWQAVWMCGIGIPCGLLLGYLLGRILLPLMDVMLAYHTIASTNPVIFIGSALFAICTVILSLRKPAKMASKISPTEAVKYSGVGQEYRRKQKKTSHGAKIYRMALSNLGRNRRRTTVTIISMSLGLILMEMIVTLANSVELDRFVQKFIDVDFQVAHAAYFNSNYGSLDETSDTIVEALKSQDGFLDGGSVYTFTNLIIQGEYKGELTNYWGRTQKYDETNGLQTEVYGMDDFSLRNLDIVAGELDLARMKSGEAVLLGVLDDDYGNIDDSQMYYPIGSQIKLKEYDMQTETYTKTKEYEVLGYYRMTYTNTSRRYGDDITVAFASEEMKTWGPISRMMYICNAKDTAQIPQIESFLKTYTEQKEILMSYVSRESYKQQFVGLRTLVVGVGGTLCAVIGIIGILNFINSISTSILARKQEFAILKGIGMTDRQLKNMLIMEGLYYALITAAVSFVASIALSYLVLARLEDILWMLAFRPTFAPLYVACPILLLLAGAVPYFAYKWSGKESIVEQIRQTEM
jgi:putative ABC transport system permease protein